MKLRMCLGVLLFVLAAGSTASQSSRVAKAEPRGECTFTPKIVDQIVADVARRDASESIERLLDEHAREHGWSLALEGPDFVDAAGAVRCPDEVLTRMSTLRITPGRGDASETYQAFAIAMQRAGRLHQALALIEGAVANSKSESDAFGDWEESRLSETAASLCMRDGECESALAYAEHWTPIAFCREGQLGQTYAIADFRARALIRLKRFDAAEELVRPGRLESWNDPFPMTQFLWIECKLASGRCTNSTVALRMLLDAAQSDPNATHGLCESGKRLWDLRHSSRDEQLAHFGELARLDNEFAVHLAFEFDERTMDEQLEAFDVVEGKLRDSFAAFALAATGNAAVQLALERAERMLGEDANSAKVMWTVANRRWSAVRQLR